MIDLMSIILKIQRWINEKDIALALTEPASREEENKYNIAYTENSKNQ